MVKLLPVVGVLLCALSGPASGQSTSILSDGSLGDAGPVGFDPVTRNHQITDNFGKYSSNNRTLFHSFSRFGIPHGDTATFSADLATPERVVARVTGGNRSEIYGTLRSTIDDADIYLLNPAGVLFGNGASLDINGSFYASSAQYLRFAEGPDFDATSDLPPPALSSADPAAFGFLGAASGPVRLSLDELDPALDPATPHEMTQLGVQPGEVLYLAGSELTIDGTTDNDDQGIFAPGALVRLAAVEGALDLPLALDAFDVATAAQGSLGLVNLGLNANVNVGDDGNLIRSVPAGQIVIRGGEIRIRGGTQSAVNDSRTGGPLTEVGIDVAARGPLLIANDAVVESGSVFRFEGGDLKLSSGEEITLLNGATVQLRSGRSAAADLGGIEVRAPALSMSGLGSTIRAQLDGSGSSAAGIDLHVGSLRVTDRAQLLTDNAGSGDGAPLRVRVDAGLASLDPIAGGDAGTLSLTNGGQILSVATNAGTGGRVEIDAGRVVLSNLDERGVEREGASTFIATTAVEAGFGGPPTAAGGPLTLHADSVELDRATLSTFTEGSGSAGALSLDVAGGVLATGIDANGSPAGLGSQTRADGAAGNVEILADWLELQNGAQLGNNAFATGDSGRIDVGRADAPLRRLTLVGGPQGVAQITSETGPNGGNSGAIELWARDLTLMNGGVITTLSHGDGDAGNLDVYAERVLISGVQNSEFGTGPSGIFSTVPEAAGTIGAGGGNVSVVADEWISLEQGGRIDTITRGFRGGGDILVASPSVEIRGTRPGDPEQGSGIYTNAEGAGFLDPAARAGGNIRVDARDIRLEAGGSISSQTLNEGDAGSIALFADRSVALSRDASITAESVRESPDAGSAGDILIDSGRKVSLEQSEVRTSSNSAKGGNVTILAKNSLYLFQSEVRTEVSGGSEDAGNVFIDPKVVTLNGSFINANAEGGNGGNVTVEAGTFLLSATSAITASSRRALDGVIRINSPNTTLTGEFAPLPETFLDLSGLLMDPCAALGAESGSFVVAPRGPIQSAPDGLMGWADDPYPPASDLLRCPRAPETR